MRKPLLRGMTQIVVTTLNTLFQIRVLTLQGFNRKHLLFLPPLHSSNTSLQKCPPSFGGILAHNNFDSPKLTPSWFPFNTLVVMLMVTLHIQPFSQRTIGDDPSSSLVQFPIHRIPKPKQHWSNSTAMNPLFGTESFQFVGPFNSRLRPDVQTKKNRSPSI